MKFHLLLELRRINRSIKALGFLPSVVYSLLTLVFVILSYYLLSVLENGIYFYLLIILFAFTSISKTTRVDFYRKIYSSHLFLGIRILEHLIVVFPFTILLLINGYLEYTLISLSAALILPLLALIKFNGLFSYKLFIVPTPFKKTPFEGIVGFRTFSLLYVFLIIVTGQAIAVGNYNLGLATLGGSFLVSSFFYAKPEPQYYVWIYSLKPKAFLRLKIMESLKIGSLLVLPQTLLLAGFFPNYIHFTLIAITIGLSYVVLGVVGKYAYYPNELNIISGFGMALSILMPPLLLVTIPVFYYKSLTSLNHLLK